ncbi:MAG: gliding motility-associated C-terminal domain-containing protein [Crocinitomicaceae bacterium]
MSSYSQGERDHWMFGNFAGVTFSTATPSGGTPNSSTHMEGVSNISSPTGDLLFYSNGIDVWDSDHNIMINGTGLLGHETFSQGVSIIKKPLSEDIYFIITLNFGPNFYSGEYLNLFYSEVDMSLNGGLGEVVNTSKNTPIRTSVDLKENNKIIQHANGYDYWLVVGSIDGTYLSYLITCEGISLTPVESAVGNPLTAPQPIGCMAANIEGTKIVSATGAFHPMEAFDFDASTGVLSNRIDLPIISQDHYYGVEFSPNGELVYATTGTLGPALSTSLFQFNLSAGSPSDIALSGTLIAISIQTNGSDGRFGQIAIGKDNKLYVADIGNDLCLIDSPNTVGTGCGFINAAIDLSPRFSLAGLPNYPNKMPNPQLVPDTATTTFLNLCLDDGTQSFTSENEGGIWSGPGISDSISGTFDPLIAGVGVHTIIYTINTPCSTFNDSIIVDIDGCESSGGNGNSSNETVVLELPNVITTNGDLINDIFQPVKIYGIDKMKTVIVNRWGNTLYESEDKAILWDGSNSDDGVYFWTIEFTDVYGNADSKHGFVTVIN